MISSKWTPDPHRKENCYLWTCWRKSTQLLQSQFIFWTSSAAHCFVCCLTLYTIRLNDYTLKPSLSSRKQKQSKDAEDEGEDSSHDPLDIFHTCIWFSDQHGRLFFFSPDSTGRQQVRRSSRVMKRERGERGRGKRRRHWHILESM